MSKSTDERDTETSSHCAEAEGAAPEAQIFSEKVLHEISAEEDEEEEEVAVTTTTTTMEDPPTISPMDPSPSPSIASALQLPSSHPARNDVDDDGGASLAAWSEWGSIPDNASKSSSSTRAKALSSSNNVTGGTSNSRGKRVINRTIYEDEGDLPSLSGGRRNCEPPDASSSSFRQQHRQQRYATPNDPPEYGYRKKVHHHAAASTGIHNIQMNSRGHVYLDGEDSIANSSSGPPGNRMSNNQDDEDNETHSTSSPPPPSDYFNQPSQRQMYPAEPRGGMVGIVSGHVEESSFVGSSEATSLASNTTRSSEAVNQSHNGGGDGEYFDGPNSALNRHLSKSSNGTILNNGNGRKKMDPQDYTETIKKQDPSDRYSSRQASRLAHNYEAPEREGEMKPLIGRQQQQQRVVYASSAQRDLYNHNRSGYQDKAKDSDLESGRASHQQNQQRVRFAEKMFSSRGNTSSSSSHQVVVGNAQSSSASSASAYGLSWRDRSISSDSSVISKSSIDSQSSNSNSSFTNRIRGGSKVSHSGGIGRNVMTFLGNGLWNIFEGLHSTPPTPASNSSTSSSSSISIGSGSGGGGGTISDKSTRFQYLKRNTAILAMLSLMMLATIISYYEAFFGAPNNGYNDDSTRGLGVEHDMRPPAMGLMDNVPHQAMLKGSVGTGVNNGGAGNNIMGGGSGALPPLVENGQVVDWDKVPPHLRGYYSKVFGVQGGANAGQQQQAMMQNAQQAQVQPDDPNAAGQAIQSIGNEAIGAVDSFKIPTLEQHEFQEHIQEIEGAIPFLGQQQQEQMQQEQEEQMQQQQPQEEEKEQLMQQRDEQVAKEELAKEELEQVHLRQQAEAEQQRAQAETEQQQQQQQEQQEQEQQSQELNAAHEEKMEREEEERRKQAEEEAIRNTGIAEAEEGAQRENMSEETTEQRGDQGDESWAASNEGNALDEVNSEAENVDPAQESAVAAEGGQSEAELDNNATLESLQSELSELMDMMKQRNSDTG